MSYLTTTSFRFSRSWHSLQRPVFCRLLVCPFWLPVLRVWILNKMDQLQVQRFDMQSLAMPSPFPGWSLHLRPFHWRLVWCELYAFVNLFLLRVVLDGFGFSDRLQVHAGTLSPTWCAQHGWQSLTRQSLTMCFGFCVFFPDSQAHLAVTNAFQVQESQPKVLFTDLPPLWFLPVKEADKTNQT